MVEKAKVKSKQQEMQELCENDMALYTSWTESYEDLKTSLLPLGKFVIMSDRINNMRLWNEYLPDAEKRWEAIVQAFNRCKPVILETEETNDESQLSLLSTLKIAGQGGRIVVGAGGCALDIMDAAAKILPTAIRGVAVAGAVLAPFSLAFDIYNIVSQAKSKSELSDKMREYSTKLQENVNKNRQLPVTNFNACVNILEEKVNQICD